MITDIDQLDLSKRYTYADYLTWQFEEMVELIRGKVYRISPAPSRLHQEVSGNLFGLIWGALKDRSCRAFSAPFDVRLPLPIEQRTSEKINTVVQPDICVICDQSKLDQQGCNGAPDLIIEILSPATVQKDLKEKFDLYQHSGVQEYWVVHPSDKTVIPYRLDADGVYQLVRKTPFTKDELIPCAVLGIEVDLGIVFA